MINRTEDPLTEALADILHSDETILRHFLRFLFPREEEADAWSRLPLCVEKQHWFPDGKIDLLLHANSDAIIVECKVAERPKTYQIDRYHAYWLRTRGTAPAIFWLARKMASPAMGRNEHLTRELFWDDLRSMLLSVRSGITTPTTLKKLDTFCRQMQVNGALLRPAEATQWQVRSKGYDVRRTETFFDEVADHLGPEFDYHLIPCAGNAHHRLRVGRRAWMAKFSDGCVRRVELRVKGGGVGFDFGLSGAILFYEKGQDHDLKEVVRGFPHWAAVCTQAGLRVRRSEGGKWDRTIDLFEAPFLLIPPVKHAAADDPKLEANPKKCSWTAQTEAVTAATDIIMRFCRIVEQF
jgi:hypothetical protein